MTARSVMRPTWVSGLFCSLGLGREGLTPSAADCYPPWLNLYISRGLFTNLPSPDDIIRLTEEINRDGARAHRSWRPYGTRLVAILERMRQFAPIGDVLVGGSQNLIACGVWAVVRLSLEVGGRLSSNFAFAN